MTVFCVFLFLVSANATQKDVKTGSTIQQNTDVFRSFSYFYLSLIQTLGRRTPYTPQIKPSNSLKGLPCQSIIMFLVKNVALI